MFIVSFVVIVIVVDFSMFIVSFVVIVIVGVVVIYTVIIDVDNVSLVVNVDNFSIVIVVLFFIVVDFIFFFIMDDFIICFCFFSCFRHLFQCFLSASITQQPPKVVLIFYGQLPNRSTSILFQSSFFFQCFYTD